MFTQASGTAFVRGESAIKTADKAKKQFTSPPKPPLIGPGSQ